MKYYFKEGKNKNVLILFHGTGGNELDLVPIGECVDADATIISFRGDVDEYGNLRFFKRYPNGKFDLEDLIERTDKLHSLIEVLSEDLDFDLKDVVLLGYSNGANMIASLLIAKQVNYKGAILMHPMVSRRDTFPSNLNQTKILITAGTNDPICPIGETQALVEILKQGQAEVSIEWFDFGHRLSEQEIDATTKWYQGNMIKSN